MNTSVFVMAAALTACAGAVSAQCQPHWDVTPGNPGNGLSVGYIRAIIQYSGGGGGDRIFVGASGAPFLSKYNPATNSWTALTIGTSKFDFVGAFGVFNPGGGDRLIVGGLFDSANGVPNTASLAMWNGTSFEAMGTGWTDTTRQSVRGMAVWNGKLYVGGEIINQPPMIAGQPWGGFAAWDGTSWTAPATAMAGLGPGILKLRVFNDGAGEALFAVGRFSSINGVITNNVAKYDGSAWRALGSGLPTSPVGFMEAIGVFQGVLYVGGSPSAGGSVFKWNGTSWAQVGQGLGGRTTSLAVFNDGSGEALYAGGGSQPGTGNIAKLVGGTWVTLGGGVDASVFDMAAIGDHLYVGGDLLNAGGQPTNRIAAWVGCPSCYPDCNGDGALNLSDFGCFQTNFALGDPYADCNGDGVRNLADFGCFQTKFALGCP